METLVVLEQHRSQYCNGLRSPGPAAYGSSPPSRDFVGMNCRSFQSAAGILPSPLKVNGSPVERRAFSSPKTPSSGFGSGFESRIPGITTTMSAPIAINAKYSNRRKFCKGGFSGGRLSFSERWAGPTYSNSPPPSSLPIPKFSVRPKRTVSLELSGSASLVKLHPIAKSAPASPTATRERSFPGTPITGDLSDAVDSATETLRRMFNLDVNDDA